MAPDEEAGANSGRKSLSTFAEFAPKATPTGDKMSGWDGESEKEVTGSVNRRSVLAGGLMLGGSAITGALPDLAKASASQTPAPPGSSSRSINLDALRVKGGVWTANDPDFDQVLYDGLWNRFHPRNRLPQILVRVQDEEDVCRCVKFARDKGLKVSVRGGGHNWCNPSLRRSGLLIDLANLNKAISIDAESRKAVLQPIISNRELQKLLNPHGLSYPSGHCSRVKLSGYILSGGMAWNQGVWGPGAGGVEAIELVTPQGELITASKNENADYFWAARGAGPGFFGVAVRYHLKLRQLPKYISSSTYFYGMDQVGAIAERLGDVAPAIPANVELSIFLLTAPPELADKCREHGGKISMVAATTFADSAEEARAATRLLDQGPMLEKCLSKTQNEQVSFERLFDVADKFWAEGRRTQASNMFSNSNPKDLHLALSDHFVRAPSPETIIMFALFTGPNVPAPLEEDAAFSMSAQLYGGPYTIWKEAADDEINLRWHNKCIEILKPFTAGQYIGETDIVNYPSFVQRCFTANNFERLEQLRRKHDPTGVFYNYYDGLS